MAKPIPTRLGDIVNFKRGYDLPESVRRSGPYPVISSAGISGWHDEYRVRGEALVTGRYGTLGEMHYYNGDYWPHNTALYVTDFKGNIPKYVYYLLTCLGHLNTGDKSTVPGINRNDLHELAIPLIAGQDAQGKIASILSALDAKIDLNNRINAELEALARTIYDYWFVQFDFPDPNGRPYKSSGGAMVWNDTLKREIPAEWDDAKLSSWIAKQKTGEWGGSEFSDNNDVQVICIRGADINALNGTGELNAPTRYISSSKRGKFLASHDIVIEISGGSPTQSTGRAALISPEVSERFDNPLVCSNFCKALTLEDPELAHEFLQLWNALYSAGIFFGWEGKTSGIKNLQFDAFVENHSVPVPPAELSHKFQNISRSMEKRKQNGLRENRELTQLRDWLLPLLMNGQVRVG
jgi:type I restriction enzyme S subunit